MADQAKQRIIRQITRLHVKREPLNASSAKRNHPELVKAVYAIKPFWGWKQALKDAGIPYNKINVELKDYCTCLICGHEAAILTSHLAGSHQLTPQEYREEFPSADIMAESIRVAGMRVTSRSQMLPVNGLAAT